MARDGPSFRPAQATALVPTRSNTNGWSNDVRHEFHELPRKGEKLVKIRAIRGKEKLSEDSCNSWQKYGL